MGPDKKVIYFLLFILFSIFAILTHPIAYALPVIALIWYIIEKRPTIKQISLALASTLGFIVLVDYGFRLHTLTSNLNAHFSIHQNALYYVSFYWRNYWIFILFGIVGFFFTNNENRKNIILLSIPFFLYLIGLSFFTEAIEYRYMFHTTVALYVIGAFGMMQLVRKIKCATSLGSHFGAQLLIGIPVVVFILLLLSHLVFIPQSFYWLEADDPAKIHHRTYYAYTPQPDFNAAYDAIKAQLKPDDIVISSHPAFTKIFLNQPGYWIAYDYLGQGKTIPNNQKTEWYVGANIIHNLSELQSLMKTKHGFIVFDLQSTSHRISPAIIEFITKNQTPFFERVTNNYSKIWVYRF